MAQDIKHPSGINPVWDGTSPLSSPTSSTSLHDLVSFALYTPNKPFVMFFCSEVIVHNVHIVTCFLPSCSVSVWVMNKLLSTNYFV